METLEKIYETLNPSLRPLCSDKFASHVIQKLLCVCAIRGNGLQAELEIKHSEMTKYNDYALKLCKYVINNIEEFIWDPYGNHILRTAMLCLSGLIPKFEEVSKNVTPNLTERHPIVVEFKTLLVSTGKRICDFPQFQEFNHDELTSGFVQTLLYSLKDIDPKINSILIKKIQSLCFTPNSETELSNIFQNECSIRLLETCLTVSRPEDYENLYKGYFEGQIGKLALMKGANFSVQRLIEYCPTKETGEQLFDELSVHFNEILERKHTGILAHLAQTCCRLHARQGPFVNSICKLLDCESKIVPSVVGLKKAGEGDQPKISTTLHGSLIIQAMLKFNKPIKIINSILEMEKAELADLFDDPKGSRIMDAFMESEYVGEKSRERLAKSLRGSWGKLAMGVHGSRSLEKVWAWATSMQQKNIMMEELSLLGQSLTSTKSGSLISAKLKVPMFVRNPKEWLESQGKEDKTKVLFADIIGDKAKKKKK